MRNKSILLSILVLSAMVLSACGGGATSTNVVESPPPLTVESTETMEATEMPTEVGTATTEPGVPITGDVNPARVSNQLDFPVLSQDGEQVGDVDDMILDLDNRSVAYVIVTVTGGATVAVPWDSLTLQTGDAGTGEAVSPPSGDATAAPEATATGEATAEGTATAEPAATEPAATADAGTGIMTGENAFVLEVDQEMLNSAPAFDPNALPQIGQPAGDWDASIRSFWEGGGAAVDATGTPSGDATAAPEATAESTATAEPAATADAGAGTGTGQAQPLQGVMLASEVIGSTITLGTGMGTDQATAVPGADGGDTGVATATPGTGTDGATATADAGAGTGTDTTQNMTATVEDLIVDTTVGNILYLVVNTSLDAGEERWIPVPLGMFQWDGMGGFILNADGTMLQNAPFFQDGQFPDTTMPDWNSEFDSFWQNNGAGTGSGTGEATATP